MILLMQLFITFFLIGLFSIGGGYAILPLIQQQVSTVHGWMSLEEVSDILAISQITPGPIAVNAATFAGMKTAGFAGACMATLGVVTPSIIICMILARFFMDFLKKPAVRGVLYGVRPIVVGLIAYAAWTAAESAFLLFADGSFLSLFSQGQSITPLIDWPMVALAAIVLVVMRTFKKIDPVLMIFASAGIGLLMHAVGI